MRIFITSARAICAVAIAIGALAGCSPSGTPPQAAGTTTAVTPVPAAVPGTEPTGPPSVVEPTPPAASAMAAPSPSAGQPARPSVGRAGSPSKEATAGASPASAAAEPAQPGGSPPVPPAPVFTEVTVPTGTTLAIALTTSHASDTSQVEDTVRGVLRRALVVDGVELVPAGAAVTGQVTAAERAGKVKGLAQLVLRFSSMVIDQSDTAIGTVAIAREASATKKTDAAKIGIGAGAGAVIGAIAGGKKGAVVGGAVGAGAGTGVVLATRGAEVELAAGTSLTTTLSRPLVVRIRVP